MLVVLLCLFPLKYYHCLSFSLWLTNRYQPENRIKFLRTGLFELEAGPRLFPLLTPSSPSSRLYRVELSYDMRFVGFIFLTQCFLIGIPADCGSGSFSSSRLKPWRFFGALEEPKHPTKNKTYPHLSGYVPILFIYSDSVEFGTVFFDALSPAFSPPCADPLMRRIHTPPFLLPPPLFHRIRRAVDPPPLLGLLFFSF